MSDTPEIVLTHERALCPRHGEPFRSQWPKGYAIFTTHTWLVVHAKPEFIAMNGGGIENIHKTLDEKALCCWLTNAEMYKIYNECDIAVIGDCEMCGSFSEGTPITTQEWSHKHVCLDCIVSNLKSGER